MSILTVMVPLAHHTHTVSGYRVHSAAALRSFLQCADSVFPAWPACTASTPAHFPQNSAATGQHLYNVGGDIPYT